VSSPAACPDYALNPLFIVLDSLTAPLAAIFILGGLVNLAKGRVWVKYVTLGNNALFMTLFFLVFSYITIFKTVYRPWVGWLLLSIWFSAMLGGSIYLSLKRIRMAVAFQCAVAAVLLTNLVTPCTQLSFLSIQIILSIFAGVIAFFRSFKKPDELMILSSAVVGAYQLVKAIGLIVNLISGTDTFPNEIQIVN